MQVLTGPGDDRRGGVVADDYAAFFDAAYPRLVAFLMVANFDRHTAEDAAQEALLHAHGKWATIEHPMAWTRRVAFRAAQRDTRSWRRKSRDPRPPNLVGDDVAAQALAKLDPLLLLVQRLPTQQRRVIAAHLEDMSTAETAALLGLTEATIRSHLSHARKTLAALVEEEVTP